MRKPFTAKPGKMTGLFLLLCIVALQWSFTSAVAGENRTAYLPGDTSTTPVAGKAAAIVNKSTTRSNRTASPSKTALAANLERETISFGSPTEGPENEINHPKITTRKVTAMGSAKATEAKGVDTKITDKKANETKSTDATITDKKAAELKVADTKTADKNATGTKVPGAKDAEVKVTDTKAPEAKNSKSAGTTSPKSAGTNNNKSESLPNKKSAPVEDQHVDELISNITRTVSADITDTKTTVTTARKVEAGNTSTKSATPVKTTGAVNTKRTATTESKSTTGSKTMATAVAGTKTTGSIGILENKLVVYDILNLKQAGLSKKVFTLALKGMSKLVTERHIKDNLLAIVDFSQPSNKKRLYVVDLNSYQLLYNTYVAHGMKSGKAMAQSFSNRPESSKSSLGFYVTGAPYQGTNGYSLRLIGVEKGINDHAMDRGIVIHGADYVCEGLLESQGFIGRSFGCPAVAQEISQELIDLLKGGSCLFIYAPSPVYKAKSSMLR